MSGTATVWRPPLEWAIFTAAGSLLFTVPPALLLLIRTHRQSQLLAMVLIHLAVVVASGLSLAVVLSRRIDETWYIGLSGMRDRLAAAATVVALTTGAVALTTLASSAALRYEPSLQFLQLLSALDIAWVTAATTIGVGWWRGRRLGIAAGVVMSVVCIWSIWSYLHTVGFGAGGSWLVDATALRRHVLPYDVMAALVAASSLVAGSRRERRAAKLALNSAKSGSISKS
jgi:hypothetical protein